MILRKWEDLPREMKIPEVRRYYEILNGRKAAIFFRRFFDIVFSLIFLAVLSPVFLCLAIMIKRDSEGPVIFSQTRITRYGRKFLIYKFRSMTVSDNKGLELTVGEDSRITKVGAKIRDKRLVELPQLVNVLAGDMSFVGTRPEVERYVKQYTPEMMATLLMPAGVTGEASIEFREESVELSDAEDPGRFYVEKILPEKMKYNLHEIEELSVGNYFRTAFRTVKAVFGQDQSKK